MQQPRDPPHDVALLRADLRVEVNWYRSFASRTWSSANRISVPASSAVSPNRPRTASSTAACSSSLMPASQRTTSISNAAVASSIARC
jgi:hypothetical protein